MAINDFGKKIGGAKKDLWKERNMIIDDLTLMNAAEKITFIKKDNVWKKPDYESLVADGLPIKVAFFMKTVRAVCGNVTSYFNAGIRCKDKYQIKEKSRQRVLSL